MVISQTCIVDGAWFGPFILGDDLTNSWEPTLWSQLPSYPPLTFTLLHLVGCATTEIEIRRYLHRQLPLLHAYWLPRRKQLLSVNLDYTSSGYDQCAYVTLTPCPSLNDGQSRQAGYNYYNTMLALWGELGNCRSYFSPLPLHFGALGVREKNILQYFFGLPLLTIFGVIEDWCNTGRGKKEEWEKNRVLEGWRLIWASVSERSLFHSAHHHTKFTFENKSPCSNKGV